MDWRHEKDRHILIVYKKLDTTHKGRIRHTEELGDSQQAMQLHPQDVLNEILRQGARLMLAAAFWIILGCFQHRQDARPQGRRQLRPSLDHLSQIGARRGDLDRFCTA